MILNEIYFFSDTLGFHTSMNVLIPKRTLSEMKSRRAQKYRTLYLLHGHSDDHTAWQRFTSIERYAEGLNLAVVMPAVHLSFYNDMAHGANTGNSSVRKCQRLCVISSPYLLNAKIISLLAFPWVAMALSNWH